MEEKKKPEQQHQPSSHGPKVSFMGRHYNLPQSRSVRVAIGIALIFLGMLGFLPVLGFWMIPLGLMVLSYEFHFVRRMRRRATVQWERRKAVWRATVGQRLRPRLMQFCRKSTK